MASTEKGKIAVFEECLAVGSVSDYSEVLQYLQWRERCAWKRFIFWVVGLFVRRR